MINKEENKKAFQPARPFWYNFSKICLFLFIFLLSTYVLITGLSFFNGYPVIDIINNISACITPEVNFAILNVIFVFFILFLVTKLTVAKKVKFDPWILTTAKKYLGTEIIYYTSKKLLIEFEVTIKQKDIEDFVAEISSYSEDFTYYLNRKDINQQVVSITPVKKQPLPKKCTVDVEDDKDWNIIPIGEAVNHIEKKVTPICWYINNNNIREDYMKTIPSNSILISGGTGSGKSVLENSIIGHISRFCKHFQMFLCDVKRVEFGRFRNVAGVKQVGVTQEEVADILENARKIMMNRFEFMEHNGVNNIYDLAGKEMDTYVINGVEYQADEIFYCEENGQKKLMSSKEIFESFNKKGDRDEERRTYSRRDRFDSEF